MNSFRTLAVVVMVLTGIGFLSLRGRAEQQAGGKEAVHRSAQKVDYVDVVPGVSKHLLWGDAEKGPYGAFTRFVPGHKNPLHTHTHDIRLVVLEGAYIYESKEGQKRVEAGEYLSIPGGLPHVSSGDLEMGALFYEESQGKFDMKVVD